MKWIIGLTLMVSLNCFAKSKAAEFTEPPIKKGALIEVEEYDSNTDTFYVKIVKEPDIGPNITTPENLYRAAGIDGKGKKKKSFVGSEFTLGEELKLLSEPQVEERANQKN